MTKLVVVCVLGVSGCGVLAVPDQAIIAVAAWSQTTGESEGCRINAMQHCVAASAVSAQCGPACAVLLGRLLEIRQLDGDPMDLHNNEAGADCGLAIEGDPDNAITCCEELLNSDPPKLRTDGRCD